MVTGRGSSTAPQRAAIGCYTVLVISAAVLVVLSTAAAMDDVAVATMPIRRGRVEFSCAERCAVASAFAVEVHIAASQSAPPCGRWLAATQGVPTSERHLRSWRIRWALWRLKLNVLRGSAIATALGRRVIKVLSGIYTPPSAMEMAVVNLFSDAPFPEGHVDDILAAAARSVALVNRWPSDVDRMPEGNDDAGGATGESPRFRLEHGGRRYATAAADPTIVEVLRSVGAVAGRRQRTSDPLELAGGGPLAALRAVLTAHERLRLGDGDELWNDVVGNGAADHVVRTTIINRLNAASVAVFTGTDDQDAPPDDKPIVCRCR